MLRACPHWTGPFYLPRDHLKSIEIALYYLCTIRYNRKQQESFALFR